MTIRMYGERLGKIADEQFQMALDRFQLGTFLRAEPVSFGLFRQNIFLSSTQGEYVLRGTPHFWWQFPTEQFFAQLLHERTQVPVPWPYQIDYSEDIFGWSYVFMPRMQGLQLASAEVRSQLSAKDKHNIARALGENLAQMQDLTWPITGRYDAETCTVRPFELARELAWPFPAEDGQIQHETITHSERVVALIRHFLAMARTNNDRTPDTDIAWVETIIAQAKDALSEPFQPCFVMEDYKKENVVVRQMEGKWIVSGLFDLMGAYFGDGEIDLSRATAMYIDEDRSLAREFVQAYIDLKSPRPGFADRFPVYMLLDRLIIWEFAQKNNMNWWDERKTFKEWASRYISLQEILA